VTDTTPGGVAVVLDDEASVYEVSLDGQVARLEFSLAPGRFAIEHVAVPEPIAGRGIAGELTRTAVERATREGRTVQPRCPYARHWLRVHPDVAERTTIDWEGRAP
jgi:uncharacterized protein